MTRLDFEKTRTAFETTEMVQDPFGYPAYYSESAREVVYVEDMVLPHCANVLSKFYNEFGDEFVGSVLHDALLERLLPKGKGLDDLLRTYGTVSIFTPADHGVKAARSRFYRAGKRIGFKVRTHKKVNFVEGTLDTDFRVQVTRR